MGSRVWWKWVSVLLVGLLVLAGCQSNSGLDPSPRAQEIRNAKRLVVGTALTAPFEFHDAESGELVGMDVEIAKAIAARIGVPIEWKEVAFADLLPMLQKGDVDMVIAAMYITPQRQEQVDMSSGYVDTGLVIVTRADETRIQEPEDLSGMVVGVKEGATGARYARQMIDEGIALKLQEYADTKDSLEDLSAEFVDAALNDKVNTIQYIKTHPDLKIVGEVLQPAELGLAVRKGDTELLRIANEVLAEMENAGKLDALYNEWVLEQKP